MRAIPIAMLLAALPAMASAHVRVPAPQDDSNSYWLDF